ncbi:DS-domain-containing protein [Corynespora cassiicola Philippines]|uniref:Deoxyhypusine synthase n=1 Tax=Corynespora cassiicola Philippines TaxID=1448308 RepID=A0A2T2P0Z3_CORCC|nr:DS-domain-containing protein [Corynespora cassiicola Philippines]
MGRARGEGVKPHGRGQSRRGGGGPGSASRCQIDGRGCATTRPALAVCGLASLWGSKFCVCIGIRVHERPQAADDTKASCSSAARRCPSCLCLRLRLRLRFLPQHPARAPSGATDAVLKPSEPVPEGAREVQGIDFDKYAGRSITVDELVGGYGSMGFQATAVGEAVRIINGMRAWKHPETGEGTTVFLGYTSNLISSGLRETLRYLVQHRHVSAIVTTAGGVEEDFIKCLAPTYLGSFSTPGAGLRAKGMNRIGNLVVPNSNYCAFEDWVVPILDKMLEEQEASKKTDEPLHWTPSKVIHRLGKEINDEKSVYYWAWKNDIPVFCPALTDGSLGDMLYFHTFKSSPEQLRIDIVEDIRRINTIAVRAPRTGMIILGGGVVKHHIANANLMRNGAESAVYINTAQEFDGSDAGARPDEAISWGKIKMDGDSVKVYAEATVVFPLIVAATPPQSPNHLHRAQSPVSSPPPPPPPPPADDVDMSASTATLPQAGQRHDRHDPDAAMHQGEGLANGHMETDHPASNGNEPSAGNNIAVEIAAVDEDAMDTTPDSAQGLVLSNGSAETHGPAGTTPTSPAPDHAEPPELGDNEQPPGAAPRHVPPPSEDAPPLEPPPPVDHGLQPPPPPPPVEPVRSDSDSSDDDDDGSQPWHPIQEDTSVPDEAELKEIEEGPEISALDHEHWENRAFLPLDEPEYTASATGRIHWTIENYNGTREKPNREIVMKSPPVNIGGYEWQIKFYPKGNDSDYLSVYVECLSVEDKDSKKKKVDSPNENPAKEDEDMSASGAAAENSRSELRETQHCPLPLLDGKKMPKRKSVAAQVAVVLYNPGEPRVNYSRTCLHRFCSGSPDWGWTRFHGPYYDIPHRIRGQRQALLRDDKLAFTGYIRIVNDETNCLWEHPSRENPWDSFSMTGLQSMMLGENTSAPGGNMISTIASWMLFKPFRNFLYKYKVADPDAEPFRVLLMLRTQVQPGAGSVTLDDVLDALEWYEVHERLDKLDVMETWEILRFKLEDELRDTAFSSLVQEMFGPSRNYATGAPSYRAPVLGVSSMQEAVNKSADLAAPGRLPQLLTIELDRQQFDTASRSYVKLLNKVSLDDHITLRGTPYTLYGFVVHKQTLHYSDSKDENMVKCLTKRQAVDHHEGKPGTEKAVGNDPIAYIAMYVRDDVAKSALVYQHDPEPWDTPEWLRAEVEKQASNSPPPIPPPPTFEGHAVEAPPVNDENKEQVVSESREFQVIDSRVFLHHEGPGVFDAYNPKWQRGKSDHVHFVQLLSTDGLKEIRERLATMIKGIEDPRQVKFWFLDPIRGSIARPDLLGTGHVEYSSGWVDPYADTSKAWVLKDKTYPWASRRVWVHVVNVADLPELPKEKPKAAEPTDPIDPSPGVPSSSEVLAGGAQGPGIVPPSGALQSEDTPMSDPDEPEEPSARNQPTNARPGSNQSNPQSNDAAMVEVEVEVAVDATPAQDPPPVDVVIPSNQAPSDTEMGGTQEDLPPPPPPPAQLDLMSVPPPPVERIQTPPPAPPPDEIYFFLKFFDAEKQTLEARGSYIAQRAARLDQTILPLLELPENTKIDVCEEDHVATTRAMRSRRSFAQNDLPNTTILIVSIEQNEEQQNALAARAAFATPQPYLAFRASQRNFPSKITGHFTYSHFSGQYFRGEYKNGHMHGHGFTIYHSGATYEGTFRLSQRHGHGLYTFQNGDTYDGDWVANQQHGSGTFIESATGNTYVGGWKNDKKFGEGVTHWKNAQETERLCRICWEESADAAFYDCGHVVACLPCARRVDNCPVCRKRVLSAMKLYYVA